jgi:hypothetical protein
LLADAGDEGGVRELAGPADIGTTTLYTGISARFEQGSPRTAAGS